jgi:hypothetical protein
MHSDLTSEWNLGPQKSDVCLQDANIETGEGKEGGIHVSRNGIIDLSACKN